MIMTHTDTYIYIYIYIYKEREREIRTERELNVSNTFISRYSIRKIIRKRETLGPF